ncbi:GNAT family N-acetyltransferase [Xylophilus sp. GW821-FHT01B05]
MPIALEHPNQPEIIRLIDELDAYQRPLYPPESHHGIDMAALSQPNVLFAVARGPAGNAIGCAAVVLNADYGEIKRMFVRPAQRGQGIAEALLGFLEAQAAAKSCRLLRLETGVRQAAAIRFYERSGYSRSGPFGDYADDPLSVFMHKPAPEI